MLVEELQFLEVRVEGCSMYDHPVDLRDNTFVATGRCLSESTRPKQKSAIWETCAFLSIAIPVGFQLVLAERKFVHFSYEMKMSKHKVNPCTVIHFFSGADLISVQAFFHLN